MTATVPETATENITAGELLTFADAETLLAASLPGYMRRPHQQALARAIETRLAAGGILLAEAGTGTGKSLAALITAILTGKRTIVATATKALQRQYADKDLPFLTEFLGVPFSWAVIMGRSNYLCPQRMSQLAAPTPLQAEIIGMAEECAGDTDVILSREELPVITDAEWRDLSMSSNECPGAKQCPFAEKGLCHAERAKEKAAAANVVITNLAYFAVDRRLLQDTAGGFELLGPIDQLIVDEAHNLDDAITSALSDHISLGTFLRLAGDTSAFLRETDGHEGTAMELGRAANALWDTMAVKFRAWQEQARKARSDSEKMPLTEDARFRLLGDHFAWLASILQDLRSAVASAQPSRPQHKAIKARLERRVQTMFTRLSDFVGDDDTVTVRWAEEEDRKLHLRSVPVSPAPFLRDQVWGQIPSVVLMSATLATGKAAGGKGDFGYTIRTLGLRDSNPAVFESGTPFDYPRQAVLYVPERTVPAPAGKDMGAWRVYAQQATYNLVQASGGGAMLLFTSRANMEDAWKRLRFQFEDLGLQVMKQGDAPTGELIRRFRQDGNAVLFGLKTFFEGVDIQGEALRLVIIDKLPFPVPTDLQFAARCGAVNRAAGRDVSFNQLSMPMMTLPLIQAAGRLLRHASDRGVIAILDPRLTAKGYGATILNSLPPARVTTDWQEAAAFLKAAA